MLSPVGRETRHFPLSLGGSRLLDTVEIALVCTYSSGNEVFRLTRILSGGEVDFKLELSARRVSSERTQDGNYYKYKCFKK